MKGSITSGVVYPPVVCELAQTYTFKSIGGTSAGAIAAACTAAAEYGRQHGQDAGHFAELEKLPQWLGGSSPEGTGSNLSALFAPQAETRPVFDTLTASMHGGKSAMLRAGLRHFPGALLGAIPGLILFILTLASARGLLWVWGLLSALLLVCIGTVLALLFLLVRRAQRVIPTNSYGLCSGQGDGAVPPLTPWLAGYIDRLAGIDQRDQPLTFGDLWGDDPDGKRNIHLEMMTTNLTHGRPYRLPFDTKAFFFDPAEFRRFFPEKVVRWMEDHPAEVSGGPDPYPGRRPLPEAADLPVIVATRLSLSFPILLSAIPLYAIDYTRVDPAKRQPERCWFSDGGTSSNFPVHFFDKPLSRWPTFAINLTSPHPDHPLSADDPSQNVWLPDNNQAGISESWTRIDGAGGHGSLSGFMGMIVNTMQNWMDNAQIRVPGYRDRVVHVSLGASEGGLNLNMPQDVIAALSERGTYAGKALVERFAAPDALAWDNHRWVRYRSVMALLEQFLQDLRAGYRDLEPGDSPYDTLIQRGDDDPPSGYRWKRNTQRDRALEITHQLLDLADSWQASEPPFGDGAPRPDPVLRRHAQGLVSRLLARDRHLLLGPGRRGDGRAVLCAGPKPAPGERWRPENGRFVRYAGLTTSLVAISPMPRGPVARCGLGSAGTWADTRPGQSGTGANDRVGQVEEDAHGRRHEREPGRAEPGAIPYHRANWSRRHGHGLQGLRASSGPLCGDQGPATVLCPRPGFFGPIRSRGQVRGPPESSQHPAHL